MSEKFNIDDVSNLASIELSQDEKAKLQKDLQIFQHRIVTPLKLILSQSHQKIQVTDIKDKVVV